MRIRALVVPPADCCVVGDTVDVSEGCFQHSGILGRIRIWGLVLRKAMSIIQPCSTVLCELFKPCVSRTREIALPYVGNPSTLYNAIISNMLRTRFRQQVARVQNPSHSWVWMCCAICLFKVWRQALSHFFLHLTVLLMSSTALLFSHRTAAANCGSGRPHTYPITSAAWRPTGLAYYLPGILTLPICVPELEDI